MSRRQLTDTDWMSRRFGAARTLLGLTQQEFSAASGVDISIIVAIESGNEFPDLPTWRKILDCFRHNGVRPTRYGVEFDPEIIDPPERAKNLWSNSVILDPYF
jgi:transcriptional regulator with XRE-family HTH domain